MEFDLNPEQQQFKDNLRRYLDKSYSFDARRRQLKSGEAFSVAHWKSFAEFGLLGLGLPESAGGTGSTCNIGGEGSAAEDTMLVMECIGRALVREPYLATVVLCGTALRQVAHGGDSLADRLLASMISGEKTLALAAHERAGRYQFSHVATTARRDGESYLLNGAKSVVLSGDAAGIFLLSARTGGMVSDEEGISLFAIDSNNGGLTVRGYPTNDGLGAADITLKDVRVSADARIGGEGAAFPIIECAIDSGIAALCAEAVGAMEAIGEQTLEYLKNRKQFGVPIGTFQSLQHRMVDMFIATEQARSMAILAALKVNAPDRDERRRVIAAAKSLVGQSARYVGQQAVQLHGGMGVVDELPISHYFKRLTAIDLTLGDAHYHRTKLGELITA
jgi:alkylation response protein AidB-like acyl-CoA dehydrogenase